MPKLATKFYETIDKAVSNRTYGKQLQKLATDAGMAGVGSDEWAALMKEFSDDPKELAQMTNPTRTGITNNSDITGTTTTTHGPDTAFMTTTTITGMIPPRVQQKEKRPTQSRAAKGRQTKR